MKVTVCEMRTANEGLFSSDWEQLVTHVRAERSDLVLLPEMPFHAWFGVSPTFDAEVWRSALEAHERWLGRLSELTPAIVLGTRPVERGGERRNEGFRWSADSGYLAVHHKYWLPNEDGFWEACWYGRGDGTFAAERCGEARVGFQICTEMWGFEDSRRYGHDGVHLLVTPRATPHSTRDKWVAGGRAAAVTAGAFSLSSNHVSTAADPVHLGGLGWIVDPDGEVLGLTSREQPFVSAEIDLYAAEAAKRTYPRYVF